jgi:hypothetical protein
MKCNLCLNKSFNICDENSNTSEEEEQEEEYEINEIEAVVLENETKSHAICLISTSLVFTGFLLITCGVIYKYL